MTTDTQETEAPEQEAEASEAAAEQAADAAPARPRFIDRPAVDRYLMPLALPILVIGSIVMFILNMSRIFLSSHDNVPVIIGTAITALILIGATVLAAAPRMRTTSLALITSAFVFAVMLGGWLALGSSEVKEDLTGPLPAEGPFSQQLAFVAEVSLKFTPSEADAETGIAQITLTNTGGTHTFVFEDSSTRLETLRVAAAGDVSVGRAYLGEPGDYVFYCTITGHREAGMEGVLHVSGDPISFEEAEATAQSEGGTAGQPGEGGGEQPVPGATPNEDDPAR